jgi:hypothetical protein
VRVAVVSWTGQMADGWVVDGVGGGPATFWCLLLFVKHCPSIRCSDLSQAQLFGHVYAGQSSAGGPSHLAAGTPVTNSSDQFYQMLTIPDSESYKLNIHSHLQGFSNTLLPYYTAILWSYIHPGNSLHIITSAQTCNCIWHDIFVLYCFLNSGGRT